MLSLACGSVGSVGLPSVEMRVNRGEVRCCRLSKGLEWWRWLSSAGDVVAQIC
jgi:hypothetical protein